MVIYLVEQPPGFGPRAAARFGALLAVSATFVVSDLTRLECRCHPLGTGDVTTLGQYDSFFARSIGLVQTLTTAVCDRAAEIRGRYRFTTADALHLAAAVESRCQVFLTNDTRLVRFPGITVEPLP